jgi:hypothetical protein
MKQAVVPTKSSTSIAKCISDRKTQVPKFMKSVPTASKSYGNYQYDIFRSLQATTHWWLKNYLNNGNENMYP